VFIQLDIKDIKVQLVIRGNNAGNNVKLDTTIMQFMHPEIKPKLPRAARKLQLET
jgi:hypothetical protein